MLNGFVWGVTQHGSCEELRRGVFLRDGAAVVDIQRLSVGRCRRLDRVVFYLYPSLVMLTARGQTVSVHGWIYRLQDGMLRDLGMNVESAEGLSVAYQAALARPSLA